MNYRTEMYLECLFRMGTMLGRIIFNPNVTEYKRAWLFYASLAKVRYY